MNGLSWLNEARLRSHGLLLALVIWSIYVWTLSTPGLRDRNGNLKGTDFLHFYTLGTLAIERRGADLYSVDAQAAVAAQRVPAAAGTRYLPLYPPQVSLAFIPFAYLSFSKSLALWWLCSASIYAACCYTVWRVCPRLSRYGLVVTILAIGFPGFFNLIAWGQTSALALALFTIFFFVLRREQEFLAGLVLGCLIFKPQLGLAAAILFVLVGSWKIVAGAIFSAIAQLSIGALYYEIGPLRAWFSVLWNVGTRSDLLEPKPYQTHCLRTFWSMLVPWGSVSIALYAISAVVVMAWTFVVWKTSKDWALRFGSLLLATILIAPHLTVYDLVIFAPGILLLSKWAIDHGPGSGASAIGTSLYFVYALPLAGPLLRQTHVQLSVVAMTILAYLIMKAARTDSTQPASEKQSAEGVPAV